MAVTVENSGTQTATIGTEHSLHTDADAKVYIFVVDTVNMVYGNTTTAHDELELRVKMKVLAAGTIRVAYLAVYVGAQAEPIKLSIPVPSAQSVEFTLKQTAGGAGRAYDWAVWSV